MMRVSITGSQGTLAVIDITRISGDEEMVDYLVQTVVYRGNLHGIYTRVVENFPRQALNSLALLKAALSTLDTDSLGLDDDVSLDFDTDYNSDYDPEASAPALARRQHRAVQEISAQEEG
jgi:hypothetical protein